ncbi:alpha beta hydrolase fold protein [Sistotremastrum niveocremeum HHB9708]|uniref:Alpha beta hydrolase fold protein n=2 Tax=Sistotremastraceae TaxID=3402574 RepID=A0A165A496_9AGAM|nr:alpha beta hydrolase fold protein [Sistotremastrum niveocremeum HHB9708]KZT43611.1 homoserine acetyltransferase [Sistotremastrum suecicum HHB10207 ss-3]
MAEPETHYYHHGRFKVVGGVIPDAITAYRTYGDSSKPCIVFPTCYGGRLDNSGLLGQSYLVGEGKALDPSKYFVVTFALFSNGESSSPSNTPAPYNGPYFPQVSYEDNIKAQHAVLTKKLGVKHIYCVVGFSMGGQQAYYWPTVFPDFVDKFVAICGSARTSPHNKWYDVRLNSKAILDWNISFLEGPKAALVASRDFDGGHYKSPPTIGIRAFGRVYSAWAYGQTWFREHQYLAQGTYPDLESWLREDWEGGFLSWDANDLLVLLETWRSGDISLLRDGGNYEAALSGIKAHGLIMPSKTDLYFPPEDSEFEVSHLKNSQLVVIDSVWGHIAGGDGNETDTNFIRDHIWKFLEQ